MNPTQTQPTDAAPFSRQVQLLTGRILMMTVRDPKVWLPNLIFTVFTLLAYNGFFGGSHAITQLTGGNYTNFLLPVSILFATLAGGNAGFALVTDVEQGFFRRQLAMPLSRGAIVLGPMIAGAVQVVFQATVVVGVALLIGARPATGPVGVLVVLVLALVWGLAYAGFSVATGLRTGSAQAAQSSAFIFFFLIFLTPLFLPKDQLQHWLRIAVTVNPATYVLDAMRSLTAHGWSVSKLIEGFAAATAIASAMLAWATAVARRATAPS